MFYHVRAFSHDYDFCHFWVSASTCHPSVIWISWLGYVIKIKAPSAAAAEALAILHGCNFASSMGMEMIIVESDSKKNISCLLNASFIGSWEAFPTFVKILRLGESFQACRDLRFQDRLTWRRTDWRWEAIRRWAIWLGLTDPHLRWFMFWTIMSYIVLLNFLYSVVKGATSASYTCVPSSTTICMSLFLVACLSVGFLVLLALALVMNVSGSPKK